MKKTYATPELIPTGALVRDTLSGQPGSVAENGFIKLQSTGSVGFYL